MELTWRNELKYFISDKDILLLKHKLSQLLKLDPNSNGSSYLVRSLYFDDPIKSGISNKLDGDLNRARYRIRSYGENKIKLELKIRKNQSVSKLSSWINKSDYNFLTKPNTAPYINLARYDNVIQDFLINKKNHVLRPSIIVEYDRVAYTVPGTDVRITLDLNVRTYKSCTNLINPEIEPVPVFLYPRLQVLEVKFSTKIPRYVTKIIESFNPNRYAISKYALCSRYIRNNSWEDN